VIRLVAAWSMIVVSLVSATALADDYVTLRGNYWRDRNTRVVQPEVELQKELPNGTLVGAHYLLDAITSASIAAGVTADQPFTELRNEAGFTLGQRLGPALVTGSYSYSSESDYWAHTASIGALIELFHKNTTLFATLSYGNDRVAQRMGPTLYNPVGGLQSLRGILTLTQIITPRLVGSLSYEAGVLGFGNRDNGWLANPYRTVNLGGAPARELVPYQRIRQSLALSANYLIALPFRRMPYLAFRPAYRFYWDDWGITSHTPELRLYVPAGPVEFRVTGRYYWQTQAVFWSDDGAAPFYPGGVGLRCATCTLAASRNGLFYTSDPKLSRFASEFFELRALIKLAGLRAWKGLPGAAWLADGFLELSYGHYFNGGYAHTAFGDAEVAGLTLSFPL
jgi:hypothetical protein